MIKLKDIITEISLVESLNSAKHKFLDTKKVSQTDFERLKSLDPSPTFKYLEKMVEFYLGGMSDTFELGRVVKIFDLLATKNQIQKKDIGSYKTWKDFEAEVQSSNSKYMAKQVQKLKSKDVDVIVNNEDLLVVIPRSHEASCAYGAGTRWCTTSPDPSLYKSYTGEGQVTLYYIIQKQETIDNRYYKMAVAVYPSPGYWGGDEETECFDALDNRIDFETVIEITGLKEWIFESSPKQLTSYEDFGLDPNQITKNDDGSISYWTPTGGKTNDTNVNMGNMHLKEIPFKFYKVDGNFTCEGNQLRSLQNVPQFVEGRFKCSDNELHTLRGGPLRVGGSFDCSNNFLHSLEWGPSEVGWLYECSFNSLKTLEGIPDHVYSLSAHQNELQSLRELGAVTFNLNVGYNKLKSLQGCPESLEGTFHCGDNHLTSLDGGPKEVGGDYICTNNKLLTSLQGAPKWVGGIFDCRNNPNLSEEEKEWGRKNIKAVELRF